MKLSPQFCGGLLALAVIGSAFGQGTFQNLGFEAVNISPPSQVGFLPFSVVFPGWTGYIGTNQAPQAFYNGVSLGAALSSVYSRYASFSNYVISGNYSAAIVAGEDRIINNSPELVSAALAQSSLIPISAKSLRFSLGDFGLDRSVVSDLLVTFNGQAIPFYSLLSGPNATVYGADISAFAGLTGELRFTEQPISSAFSTVYLDSIAFSPQAIPEPGVFSLVGLGALFLGWRLSRRARL